MLSDRSYCQGLSKCGCRSKTVRFHHLAIDDGQDTGAQEILDDDAHMSDLLLELADSLN